MKSSRVVTDAITSAISNNFDYDFDGLTTFSAPEMPMVPDDFGIGLIVGPSGSGKSTLLERFGREKEPTWDSNKAIASHFSDADDAAEKLGAVGLNSIPTWMKPFHVLSTGERFRAALARCIGDGAVIDEFTSVVDRNVAKSCARALSRYVEKRGIRKMVLATCHYDVEEWLQPDWVFDTQTGKMSGRRSERPSITLDLIPCQRRVWEIFRSHHYLDSNINKSARCWVALWRGNPVGFTSVIAFPNGNWKNGWREHRTVVLPDYQGLGVGNRISDAMGDIVLSWGGRFFSKTSHIRMGGYRNSSPAWRPTSKNGIARKDYKSDRVTKESGHRDKHAHRVCYSHEYIGYQC